MRFAATGLALLLLASPALAERVGVQLSDQPGNSRVVLDLAAPDTPYRVENWPRGTFVRLGPNLTLDMPASRRMPRNLRGIEANADGLLLTTRPGTHLRHQRAGNRLVLEVLDGPPPRAGRGTPAPEPPTPLPAAPPSPAPAPAPPALTAAPVTPVAIAPLPPPAEPPAPAPTGTPLRLVADGDRRALALPLAPETALAILRRGDLLLIVLDQPQELDATPLRDDPVFGALEVETRPEATVLRLPLAAPASLRARREGTRWLLTPVGTPERERSILAEPEGARMVMRVAAPGRPVPIPDPETGLPLLLGTVREPGQAMGGTRSLAQLDLLPTQLGVAALARADTASLRRVGDRFVLSGVAGVAALPDAAEAAAMSRLMDLTSLDNVAANERQRAQSASLAATPPLARLPIRRAAAEGLLSLGMAHEAQSMMRLAFQEDSRASTDPAALLVHGAAALLANRPAEAANLLSPSLPPSDELTLWRAVLAAAKAEPAATGFAATLPLMLTYPEPVRARLLPLAADALIEAGDLTSARRLLRTAGERPDLAFARARLAEAEGRRDEALSLYAAIGEGRDRLARARALRRSAELRLAAGMLDNAGAAAALEAALFAWRGDGEEFATRLRIAALRQAAGDSRAALDLLRDTGETFPDRAEALRAAQETALIQALAQEQPTVAIALFEANDSLLPRDARGTEALLGLAERLAGMDLPDRAAALAQRAGERATPAQRPALALQLAGFRLAAGDAPGALAALESAPATPENTVPHGLLAARSKSRLGDTDGAAAILRSLGTPGLPALAALLAERQDWAGAADAAAALAAARPDDASTPREVLRAAAFATLARDTACLAALRADWSSRLGTGPLAEAFRLLTTDPVQGLADLPRLTRELDLFRGISAGLEAFRTAAAVSR